MALHHASSGEVIAIHPLGDQLEQAASVAYLKSEQLEIMRIVLGAGKSVPEHQVNGEMTLQCIEGEVEVLAHGTCRTLHPYEMVFLAANVPYALRAARNSSLLMTVAVEHE